MAPLTEVGAETSRLATAAAPVVLDVRVVNGSGGGPDKTILNSPRFLGPLGYRMLCAYLHPPGDPGFDQLRRKADAWGAPLLSVEDRGPWDWRVVSGALAVCRRERVAVWHGHDYKSNLLGLLLRPFWPMRLVTTVHGWGVVTRRTALYYALDRRCLPRYERVVCVSPDLLERCLACGVPAERCVLLENAIDTHEFRRRSGAASAKQKLGIPPERRVVGAVGRLSAEKGFDRLIEAADALLRSGLDLQLLIAGEGDERPALERQIARLGLGERVRLSGYRPDTREVYEALDVFALSSLSEGLPNVLLEAMALEVPVVSTRVGGVPRLVRDGENGLLVGAGSAEALALALARLLGDAGLRERLGRAGRATVEAGYDFEGRMRKMAGLYDQLFVQV